MFTASIPLFIRLLRNMDGWLDKASAHAVARSFDANTLLAARLAPDQFSLVRQLRAACDTAKLCGARLAGIEAPVQLDDEQTLDEVRARIASTVAFLESVTEESFRGASDRTIVLSFFPAGLCIGGANYLNEFAIPNFHFHASMAYAILRHNGVDLGKRDFISTLSLKPAG